MFKLSPGRRAAAILGTLAIAATAFAAPLTGFGPNLPIPTPNPGAPLREAPVYDNIVVGSSFDGTWSAPALAPWHGTFYGTGPIPSGLGNPAGSTRYNFTTLNGGILPIGTYFAFGDVDGGSTQNETFVMQAFDATGGLITTPWLDEPFGVSGVGTGSGSTILPGNLPGWDWDNAGSSYLIDGSTVTGGNPSVTAWLENNTAIGFLNIERTSQFANFGIAAPIPEPGAALLLLLMAPLALRRS